MATIQENIDAMSLAFSTHMKNKNPGYDTSTETNINDFALAYATAIANAIGAGSDSIPLGDYVKKTGGADGVMSGKFTANAGFEAGFNSSKQIETSSAALLLYGVVNLSDGILKGHDKEMLKHDDSWLRLNNAGDFTSGIYLYGPQVKVNSELVVGADTLSGFYTNGSTLKYKGGDIYHVGNSNLNTVDWTSKNMTVAGDIGVTGYATFSSLFTALNGVSLGHGGNLKLEMVTDGVKFHDSKIYLPAGFEIHDAQNTNYIIKDHSNGAVTISAAGTNLHLGYQNTSANVLAADLYNYNVSRKLIDKFGFGTMHWGFSAGTLGDKRFEMHDLGVKYYGELHIDDSNTKLTRGASYSLRTTTPYGYIEIGSANTSRAHLKTDRTDGFHFDKHIWATTKVGIWGSTTRIEDNKLLLNDSNYLYNATDGIRHYGHSYITGNIGTESFSSGFAGTGWRIDQNAAATFTDLVVRRKLKVYEFEIEKITAVNGSFWVSANCSGETVTKL